MNEFIFYPILVLEIFIFVKLDFKKWKTYVTPFTILAVPFCIVTGLSIIYSYSIPSVKDFYFPSLIVWMLGLAVFYVPTCFIPVNPNKLNNSYVSKRKGDDLYPFLYTITMLFLLLALYKIRSIGVQSTLGTDEFSDEYGSSGGAFAHISMFLSIMFAYFVYKLDRRHKLAIIPIVLILITTIAQASKTHILSPIIIGFFTLILTGKIKFTIKTVSVIVFAAAGVFFGIYFISLVISGTTDSYEVYFDFVTHHFLAYFLGGSLSFSLDFKSGIIEPDMTFGLISPFISVFEKITGVTSTVTIENPIFLNMGGLGETNVRTFFGTIFAYSHSYVVLILLSFFMGSLIYYIYYLSYITKNLFLIIATSANLTYLVFGSFFDFYRIHIYPYEIVIICLLLYFISSCKCPQMGYRIVLKKSLPRKTVGS